MRGLKLKILKVFFSLPVETIKNYWVSCCIETLKNHMFFQILFWIPKSILNFHHSHRIDKVSWFRTKNTTKSMRVVHVMVTTLTRSSMFFQDSAHLLSICQCFEWKRTERIKKLCQNNHSGANFNQTPCAILCLVSRTICKLHMNNQQIINKTMVARIRTHCEHLM